MTHSATGLRPTPGRRRTPLNNNPNLVALLRSLEFRADSWEVGPIPPALLLLSLPFLFVLVRPGYRREGCSRSYVASERTKPPRSDDIARLFAVPREVWHYSCSTSGKASERAKAC